MTDLIDFPPSADVWAAAVQSHLLDSEKVYRILKDDDARRRYATLTLGGLFERLEQIPALKGLLHLHVCRDTLDFFDDLHRGRDHPWRSLGPFGGLQQYTKVEERARAHALVGVEIMIDAAGSRRGAKKIAFECVAGHAAKAGYDLSPARIKGLYYELQKGRFPHPNLVTTFVSDFWQGNAASGEIARCEHGHPVHRCSETNGGRCANIYAIAETYLPGLFVIV